jgi:adenine-specific DNA methylase
MAQGKCKQCGVMIDTSKSYSFIEDKNGTFCDGVCRAVWYSNRKKQDKCLQCGKLIDREHDLFIVEQCSTYCDERCRDKWYEYVEAVYNGRRYDKQFSTD